MLLAGLCLAAGGICMQHVVFLFMTPVGRGWTGAGWCAFGMGGRCKWCRALGVMFGAAAVHERVLCAAVSNRRCVLRAQSVP